MLKKNTKSSFLLNLTTPLYLPDVSYLLPFLPPLLPAVLFTVFPQSTQTLPRGSKVKAKCCQTIWESSGQLCVRLWLLVVKIVQGGNCSKCGSVNKTEKSLTHTHIQTLLTQLQPLAGEIIKETQTKAPFSLSRRLNLNINFLVLGCFFSLFSAFCESHIECLTTK